MERVLKVDSFWERVKPRHTIEDDVFGQERQINGED